MTSSPAEHTDPASPPSGVSPAHSQPIVDQLVDKFLDGYSATTQDTYRSHLRTFHRWCADNDIDPLTATAAHLTRYVDWLGSTRLPDTGRKRRPTSVTSTLSPLAGWYDEVLNATNRTDNPTAGLAHPPRARSQSKPRARLAIPTAVVCDLVATATPETWHKLCAHLVMHLQVDHHAAVTSICRITTSDIITTTTPDGTTARIVHLRDARNNVHPIELSEHVAVLLEDWLTRRPNKPSQQALLLAKDSTPINRSRVAYLTLRFLAAAQHAGTAPDPPRHPPRPSKPRPRRLSPTS